MRAGTASAGPMASQPVPRGSGNGSFAALLTGLTGAAVLLIVAREVFGDEVVDHYVHAARVEVAAFDSAVTDWERVRGFERL
mgnify:CR=1 FL=1